MDQELKEKWLTALRSGEYKQGFGVLRDGENHFCCLGVLADLIDKDSWRSTDTSARSSIYTWQGEPAFLPESVLPTLVQTSLSAMNDQGAGFIDIANRIEKEL